MSNAINRTVSAEQSNLIARARKLRASVWTHHYSLGAEFSRELARGWSERGLAGMAAACWDLSQLLAEVPGSWDRYSEAKALAADLATA